MVERVKGRERAEGGVNAPGAAGERVGAESTISSLNRAIYRKAAAARDYIRHSDSVGLFEGEKNVLGRIRSEIAGAPILDVGVGAGRTTAPLLEISSDYLGIDWSESMISACRARFSQPARFLRWDARDIGALGTDRFAFVWFSFNGLDCLDHEERMEFLRQAFQLLRPGGLLFFSSHNRSAPREKPWDRRLYLYEWSRNPLVTVKSLVRMANGVWNYLRRAHIQATHGDYEIRIDSGHEFSSPMYYSDPEKQADVLRDLGFIEVQTLAWSGAPFPPSAPNIERTAHVYYLARKPA